MTELNPVGAAWAEEAIARGNVNRDQAWRFDAADSTALLGDPPDWGTYPQWFLGHDPNAPDDTKEAWKYPLAKSVDGQPVLFRSALEAIRHRSAQHDAEPLYETAGRLLGLIDGDQR